MFGKENFAGVYLFTILLYKLNNAVPGMSDDLKTFAETVLNTRGLDKFLECSG